MGPVRIKCYGLMWLTRPTYLVLQSIGLFLNFVLMALNFLLANAGLWIGIFLFVFIVQSIKTFMMLNKFDRAEAEQQAKLVTLDAGDPAPLTPPSTAVQSSANISPPNTNIQS